MSMSVIVITDAKPFMMISASYLIAVTLRPSFLTHITNQ